MIKKGSIFFIIFLFSSLWPFIWKGKESSLSRVKQNWVYVENKKTRSIAFLEFENETTTRKEDFASFKSSIPKALARQMDNLALIGTPADDYIPQPKNQNNYNIFKISFDEALKLQAKYGDFVGKTQYQTIKLFDQELNLTNDISSIISQTNQNNENLSLTNQDQQATQQPEEVEADEEKPATEEEKIIKFLTESKVAYIETNQNEYIYYGFKGPPSTYFDAQLIRNEDIGLLEIPLYTNENQIRFFKDTTNLPKALSLNQNLYSFNVSLKSTIEKIDADYFVYGRYRVEGINFFIDVFVINKYTGTIKNVFSKRVRSSLVRNELRQIPQFIFAYLQGNELVENVTFTSEPEGARLYLDGKFRGKLPLTFATLEKKKYAYRVSLERHHLKEVATNLPGDENYLDVDRSNAKVDFDLGPIAGDIEESILTVDIENNVLADFYFNTDLVVREDDYFTSSLLPGDYYLILTNAGYETKNIKIEMRKGQDLDIGVKMRALHSDPLGDFLFDHERNVRVFSILGFLFSTGAIATYLQALSFEDKRDEVDRRLTVVPSTTLGYSDLANYRNYLTEELNNYSLIAGGIFAGALLSFVAALFSHNFDVWEDRIKIESNFAHTPDVRFTYQTSVRF